MRSGARIRAAAEVLAEVIERHRPTSLALADWGKSHRFAGSGDRNAIGGIVYDALRRRSSIAWALGSEQARALAIGAAGGALAMSPEEVIAACDGSGHALEPLSPAEAAGLSRPLDDAPPHVQADVPDWLWPHFLALFGESAITEGQAFTERAPSDLRVNTLKATRDKVLKALKEFGAEPTRHSPIGVRVPAPIGPTRTPNLQAEAAFQAGWFEVQDEGSQVAALLAGAGPRLQVLDLCAGAGGKTLAMAAQMQNTGQIYAYDQDRLRLKPIFERVKRAGVRNAQILRGGDAAALAALGPRFDVVLVDAPCTGTGTWRRRPEAKWRLKSGNLDERIAEQRTVLGQGAALVKPGGSLVYVTCSVLAAENSDQVRWFCESYPEFRTLTPDEVWKQPLEGEAPRSAAMAGEGLLLTPRSHGTDGFYIAVLTRNT